MDREKILIFVVCILLSILAFLAWPFPMGNNSAKDVGAKIQAAEHKADTVYQSVIKHDTVERDLRAKAKAMIKRDTIPMHDTVPFRDTICLDAFDTLSKALDECDSAKALRDTIIHTQDTVIKLVRDSAQITNKPSVEGYAITALISAVLGGLLILILR